MPLLLTSEHVRPLLERPDLLDRGFEAIEQAIIDHDAGMSGCVSFSRFELGHGGLMEYNAASSENVVVRVFPPPGTGPARPNAQVMLVFDGDSGQLIAVVGTDDLNTVRTALPCAVAARHLAPHDATTLCVLGSSTQARAHARLLLHAVPQVKEILVWSPTPAHREAFARDTETEFGVSVRAAATLRAAVEQADIVAAAGLHRPDQGPAYDPAWLRPGALHISMTRNAPPGLRARVYVPSLQRPVYLTGQRPGPFTEPPPDPAEFRDFAFGPPPYDELPSALADVLARRAPARESPTETLVAEFASMYNWESRLAKWVCDWAVEAGAGIPFDLTPEAPLFFPGH